MASIRWLVKLSWWHTQEHPGVIKSNKLLHVKQYKYIVRTLLNDACSRINQHLYKSVTLNDYGVLNQCTLH